MHKYLGKAIGVLFCCGLMSTAPFTAYADNFEGIQLVEAKETAGSDYIEEAMLEAELLTAEEDMAGAAGVAEELEADAAAEAEAEAEETRVFMRTSESREEEMSARTEAVQQVSETVSSAVAEAARSAAQADAKASVRQNVVNYALSFVGGPYRYGGNDPRTGVDCSGFTRFVLSNAAGVPMARSSRSQAAQGVAISAEQMQPGDLIFYGNGSSINHVAMYIGSGQIVHASTYKTGIKVSNWNYRTPVKIINVIG
ncbi:MAG: C40 family peptidase [Lachnospiraceae bacterium]|nr:C40 family peptidase [Lachnospiraceae bacterium]